MEIQVINKLYILNQATYTVYHQKLLQLKTNSSYPLFNLRVTCKMGIQNDIKDIYSAQVSESQ